MQNRNLLEETLDLQLWNSWQKTIAEITGMAVLIVDYCGEPVNVHEGKCEFCKIIRNDSVLGKYCKKCDALGSLEAVMAKKPYIYKCHFSLVDVAIPIVKDNYYLGSVMAGQVRMENSDYSKHLVQIMHVEKEEIEKKRRDLQRYYDLIPVFTQQQLNNAVTMIYNCTESFIRKNSCGEKSSNKEAIAMGTRVKNRIIAQAVDFIYKQRCQKVSLTEVAEHCHVSASYLSRLFLKELGENYSEFVAKLKITWAKEMLKNTDMKIVEISDKLGYGESGYFIKFFKKYERQTPLNYRNGCK